MAREMTKAGAAVTAQNVDVNLAERFIKFAGVAEKSERTYKIALRQMFNYFAAESIQRPARVDVENWRDSLIEAKKSASTIQLYCTAAKIFFRWLSQEGIYPNIADHMKSKVRINHEHKKDALTKKQASTLIKTAGKREVVSGKRAYKFTAAEVKEKRDKAIIALMATAGLRTIEVSRADIADLIQWQGRFYLVVQGKGRSQKDAKILLAAQVVTLIKDYLKIRGGSADAPLFVSTSRRNKDNRLSTDSISRMVKKNLRAMGIDTPRITAHSLRHTAATTMLLAGVELTQVQQVLRHTNINTTMIYNNAVERMKNQAEQVAANEIFAGLD